MLKCMLVRRCQRIKPEGDRDRGKEQDGSGLSLRPYLSLDVKQQQWAPVDIREDQ